MQNLSNYSVIFNGQEFDIYKSCNLIASYTSYEALSQSRYKDLEIMYQSEEE